MVPSGHGEHPSRVGKVPGLHSRPSIWCLVLLVRRAMAKKGRFYNIANTRSHSCSLSPALRSETYHLSVGRSSRSLREKVLETYRKDTRSTSHLQNHLSAPSEVSVPASTRAAQLRPADERPAPMLPPWWRDWWRDRSTQLSRVLKYTLPGKHLSGTDQRRPTAIIIACDNYVWQSRPSRTVI